MILLDYNSLLVALSFSSAGLALTFFVSWFVSRTDRVLMTWAIGASFMVVSVFVYSDFVKQFSPAVGETGFAALSAGLVFFLGAGHQFRTGVLPLQRMAIITTAAVVVMAVPMFQGYDGLAYIAFNIAAAAILFATAWEYWRWRTEAYLLILTLSGLYAFTGLSFLLCAAVLIGHGSWVMNHAPENWAENINLVVSLTDMAGIGALSLGLNQVRLTRRHKQDAETDVLTGLFNRRALFDRSQRLPSSVAVIVFDIDHFKQVNDVHGHQIGDLVLQTFGSILAGTVRGEDLAARLGGEEFAIVLPEASLKGAAIVAERVRRHFAELRFVSQAGYFNSSVSAGVSHTENYAQLTDLVVQADAALYAAKRSGRDRVVLYSNKIASAPPVATSAPVELEVAATLGLSGTHTSATESESGETARLRSSRKGRLLRRV